MKSPRLIGCASNRMRRGVALVEVLVAGVVLATAATAALGWLAESQGAVRAVRLAERDVIETSEALDRLMLLGRDSLAPLRGWSQRGRWALNVGQAADTLFEISLSRQPGGVVMLSTTVYRPFDAASR
jgi:Tfp pilus assembly protein PilV